MPEEGVKLTPSEKLLTTNEIFRISSLFIKSLGIEKIRLTGGEPLIRKDLIDIIGFLNNFKENGLNTIAITTNGLVLERKCAQLKNAGLDSINISLDTLKPEKFELITRRKGHSNVLKAIEKSLEVGFNPVKINCVIMKGVNDDEIDNFVHLTRNFPIDVRFIEYMPFDGNKWSIDKMIPNKIILDSLKLKYFLESKPMKKNDTSRLYKVKDFKGNIGFISSMSDNFCSSCNRLRITADGHLKVCLFEKENLSLRDLMRSGADDYKISQIIKNALMKKKKQHAGAFEISRTPNRPMILIGGTVRNYCTFSHLDSKGQIKMVDISNKTITNRIAIAEAQVKIDVELIKLIKDDKIKKGNVINACKIAGILAAKKCSELIPLCHNIVLDNIEISIELKEKEETVFIRSTVSSNSKTGVEMEAMTAVTLAALNLYDMCKYLNRNIIIKNICLISKKGGKYDYMDHS